MNGSAKHCADRGTVYFFNIYDIFYIFFFFLTPLFPEKSRKHRTLNSCRPRKENLGKSFVDTQVAKRDIYNYVASNVSLIMTRSSMDRPMSLPARYPFGALEVSSSHRDRGAVTVRPDHSRKMYNKFLSFSSQPLAHSLTRSSKDSTHFSKTLVKTRPNALFFITLLPSPLYNRSFVFFLFFYNNFFRTS